MSDQPLTRKQLANLDKLTTAQVRHEAMLWGLQDTKTISKEVCIEYILDSLKVHDLAR